jgi:CheY-like chemotaxis protein
MKKNWIPAFYFPTTTLIVDDSREFLSRFSKSLDPDISCLLYTSPRDAVRAIQTTPNSNYLINQCFSEYVENAGYPLTNHTISVDISDIYQGIYNSQRFNEISVVIVDSTMPGMNGFEFCECINNRAIKKILLADGYQERLAINAFNAKTIDLYFNKNDPFLAKQISQYIKSLQRDYFQTKSNSLNEMLAYSSAQCLLDDKFTQFFNQLCAEHHIVEHYLIENTGSFLLVNAEGALSCLIVKNRQDLCLHYELAADNAAPNQVLEQLEKGQSIPYCWPSHEFCHFDNENWPAKLYPAQKLQGNDLYYYALITVPFSQDIKFDKIQPYSSYLKQRSHELPSSQQFSLLAEAS